MKKKLFVISGTHWDREWYQTFQNYRFRLVRVLDDLIEQLESGGDYRCFHLDGQTIVLEDYLRIRPEMRERLTRQIQDGRILIGPWYVQPDEYLVSGESLVRNLQKGFEICRQYGVEPLKCGYVVDVFGHSAQLPQILRGFGIDNAILFRGIADYPKDTFLWKGADGSELLTFKLSADRAYSNYFFAIREPFQETGYAGHEEEIAARFSDLLARSEQAAVCPAMLMMDGVDHIDADPELPSVLRFLRRRFPDLDIRQATLQEYIDEVKALNPTLDVLEGPLYFVGRKGLCNNVFRTVASSMVFLKQQNDRCETKLLGIAEPLDLAASVLARQLRRPARERYATPRWGYFQEAWRYLLMNHPHDSICGCSYSEVHKDNVYRFRQAEQIADRMIDDSMQQLCDSLNTAGHPADYAYLVCNTAQSDLDGAATLTLPMPASAYPFVRLTDAAGREIPYQILHVSQPAYKEITKFRTLMELDTREAVTLALPLQVAGNGYTTLFAKEDRNSPLAPHDYALAYEADCVRYLGTMRTARNAWDNGVLTVSLAPNGTLTVCNKETGRVYSNVLAFEDCADCGEGWTYRKPTCDQEYVTVCGDVDFAVESDGPFAAALRLTRQMRLPKQLQGNRRSAETEIVEVSSRVTILKSSHTLQIETTVHNTVMEHRLRVLLPTGMHFDTLYTLGAFDMQAWPVEKADWSAFREPDTQVDPTQGCLYVSDGDDTVEVYGKGLYEVEVAACDRTIALTLFRSFNWEYCHTSSELGRLLGTMQFEYAFSFYGKSRPADALRRANAYKRGLQTERTGVHEGTLPTDQQYLRFDAGSSVISALYTDRDGSLLLRFFNPSDEPDQVSVRLACHVDACRVEDLKGDAVAALPVDNNTVTASIGPHQIMTMRFEPGK